MDRHAGTLTDAINGPCARAVPPSKQGLNVTTPVPFYRPDIGEPEIEEAVASLRSGWLTTGPRVKRFEEEFARAVSAPYAVAMNSCTAALHLAIEALGVRPGDGVL